MTIAYKTIINYPNGKPDMPDALAQLWSEIDPLLAMCLSGPTPMTTDNSVEQGGFTSIRYWVSNEIAQQYVDLVNTLIVGIDKTVSIIEEEV